MRKTRFGVRVTKKDGTKKLIDHISLPVLRGSLDVLGKMEDNAKAEGVMMVELGEDFMEVVLTEEQICNMNLERFRETK
ncbi:MAG: hypothetical protein FWF59_00905 [Turicibacter sp.]|nr:hypothetical protein [Turicibacter sp.]